MDQQDIKQGQDTLALKKMTARAKVAAVVSLVTGIIACALEVLIVSGLTGGDVNLFGMDESGFLVFCGVVFLGAVIGIVFGVIGIVVSVKIKKRSQGSVRTGKFLGLSIAGLLLSIAGCAVTAPLSVVAILFGTTNIM